MYGQQIKRETQNLLEVERKKVREEEKQKYEKNLKDLESYKDLKDRQTR